MSFRGPHIPDPRDLSLGARARIIADVYAPYLERGMRVLDIGCGNAVVARHLAERFALEMRGCDIADYRKTEMPFTPLNPDGRLPFADRTFDVAMLNDVLHHERDQPHLLREAVRVAGTVLAFELEPGPSSAFFDKLANFFHHRTMRVPLLFRTADEWRALLAREGVPATVTALGRPRAWYPLRHILIVASNAETRPARQSADRNVHP